MDIATESVTVRRDKKTATVSVDGLRALALTAVKNAVDPSGNATFAAQDASVNSDGSVTVSLSIETVQPDPAPDAPAAPPAQTPVVLPTI